MRQAAKKDLRQTCSRHRFPRCHPREFPGSFLRGWSRLVQMVKDHPIVNSGVAKSCPVGIFGPSYPSRELVRPAWYTRRWSRRRHTEPGGTMRTILVVVLLLLLAMPAAAQQVGSFVDITQRGESSGEALALTADGHLFQESNSPDNTWTYLGSIPDLAGSPAAARFVAIANWTGYTSPAALTSAGASAIRSGPPLPGVHHRGSIVP